MQEREPAGNGLFGGLLQHYDDGRIKLWLTEKLLNLRRERRALFSRGNYLPLPANGSKEENVSPLPEVTGASPLSWLLHASRIP